MRITLLYISLLPCIALLGGPLAPWVGPNVRLGEDPAALPGGDGKNQAEPHVTRSISDPDLILATFQEGRYFDGGAVSNGYAVSEDGGFSWRRELNPNLTLVTGGPYYRGTDPVAAISLDGTMYLNSLVSVDQDFGLGRLVIQRSDDRGHSWTDPITIYTGKSGSGFNNIFPDKNWMVVNDISGTPNLGRIVVTWTNFRTIRTDLIDTEQYLIMSSYSDNLGESWSSPAFVTPTDSSTSSLLQYQASQPVFLARGDLAIVYHNFHGSTLEVRYSPDGGVTYPYEPDFPHAGYNIYDAPNIREGAFLPSVDAASETGDLFIAYVSKIFASDTFGHVHFVRSHRSGPDIPAAAAPQWNFSPPVIISGLQPLRVVCTPTIAVSPDGQRVVVYFYDNRNGTGINDSGDFYAVQSMDGGGTWSQPFRISDQTFPLNRATNTSRGYMLGDYFGLAPPMNHDQAAVAVWVGTPLATADPWSARIGSPGLSVLDSWIQANLPHAWRYGNVNDHLADPDRDGTPNFIEYITGRSPRTADEAGQLDNGFTHYRINAQTDPATQVDVYAGSGDWPSQQQLVSVTPDISSIGEGYWDELAWQGVAPLDHLQFVINGAENWYLLQKGSPSRWVLDVGGNWVWSPWLGYIETTHAPWLFHEDLGWVYDLRGAMFSPALDAYLLSSPRLHPWIYTSRDSFIYLPGNRPWAYDVESAQWIQMY